MEIATMIESDIDFTIIAMSGFFIAMIFYFAMKKKKWGKNDIFEEIIKREKIAEHFLYRKLLKMVLGSRNTAKRLIKTEKRIKPNLSKSNLIRAAIDRIQENGSVSQNK